MKLQNYEHIIWDWNGTLLNDANLCVEIINTLLTKRRLSALTLERYREVFTFPIIHYYEKLGFDFSQETFESIGTEFITMYEKMRNRCSLMPDATKTLNYFAQLGLTQSVLSASKQSYLIQAIGSYGIDSTFMEINGLNNHYASSKIDIGKDFITRNKLDPTKILLIGDTTHDADVAASIGADCCLIPNGHQSQKILVTCGVPVVGSLTEFCE